MEVDCVRVVSGSSSRGFVMVVVLEDFGLVLWSSWRIVLWCWNERGYFLGHFSLKLVVGNMFDSKCMSLVIRCVFLDFFE